MVTMRFGSYNLLSLFASDAPEERSRYDGVVDVIRALDADVLAVQEITGAHVRVAEARHVKYHNMRRGWVTPGPWREGHLDVVMASSRCP